MFTADWLGLFPLLITRSPSGAFPGMKGNTIPKSVKGIVKDGNFFTFLFPKQVN